MAKGSEKSKKPRISYGTVEIPESDFKPENNRFRVTIWLDLDLVEKARKLATAEGSKYQPWLNRFLRKCIMGAEREINAETIARELKLISARVQDIHKWTNPAELYQLLGAGSSASLPDAGESGFKVMSH